MGEWSDIIDHLIFGWRFLAAGPFFGLRREEGGGEGVRQG
jgi:hypothetical protein